MVIKFIFMPDFKVQDFVKLMKINSPNMIISEIDEGNKTALCVWYDLKKNKISKEYIPLNVLEIAVPIKFPQLKSDKDQLS